MNFLTALTAAFISIPSAFAVNPAKDLLALYESKDIDLKCEVSYENDVFTIASLDQVRASYQRYVTGIDQISSQVIRLNHSDYDGKAEVFLIQTSNALSVLASWKDGENGFDASSFCELPLKATSHISPSGPQNAPPSKQDR